MSEKRKSPFCLMPFTTMNIAADGSVSLCRNKGGDYISGSLKENSLAHIWNGDHAKNWRKEFLDQNLKTCDFEIENLSCHLCDLEGSLKPFVKDFHSPKILRLGANFNGECNLRCRMCGVWKDGNLFDQFPHLWDELEKDIFPHLKIIDLFSGEPLIQENTFRIAEWMNKYNSECRFHITTNGNWNFDKKMADLFLKIKLDRLVFSIDTLDEKQYQEIRKGGDLTLALKNLKECSSFFREKKTSLWINFLVMQDNLDQLEAIYKLGDILGLHISIGILRFPKEYSILNFSDENKKNALHFLFKNPTLKKRATRVINTLLHALPPIEKKEFLLKNLSSH